MRKSDYARGDCEEKVLPNRRARGHCPKQLCARGEKSKAAKGTMCEGLWKGEAGKGGHVQGEKEEVKAGTSNDVREDCWKRTLRKGGCV